MNKNKKQTKHFLTSSNMILAMCFVLFIFVGTSYAKDSKSTTNISLTITANFSGSTQLLTPGFSSGGVIYISGTNIDILLQSSVSSTYTLSGNTNIFTGSGTGSYTTSISTILSTNTEGPKVITSNFITGSSVLVPPPLQLFLDTTAPSRAIPLSPILGQTTATPTINFSRNPSIDTGAGLREYRVIISTTPSFSSPISFTTTTTSLSIDQTLLPTGTLYRYIESIDNVGHSSSSSPSFFEHNRPDVTGGRQNAGGGSQSLSPHNRYTKSSIPENQKQTISPKQDDTTTLYDSDDTLPNDTKAQEATPQQDITDDTTLYDHEESIKKQKDSIDTNKKDDNTPSEHSIAPTYTKGPPYISPNKQKIGDKTSPHIINQQIKQPVVFSSLKNKATTGSNNESIWCQEHARYQYLRKHLMLLAEHMPNDLPRNLLLSPLQCTDIISYNHKGLLLILFMLCYDIQLYNKRYYQYLISNIKK